jgi:ribosome maturation factor RimP
MTDRPAHERVREVVEPSLTAAGFELIDVERQGSVLRVTVDLLVGPSDTVDLLVGPSDTVDLLVGPSDTVDLSLGGIDLEGVTAATRIVSDLLDSTDLIGDRTTLEVSSPGIERSLRTPEHFQRFVGTEVAVKTRPGTEGERRVDGVLETADDEGVVVAGRRLSYGDIERAHTVFVWPTGAKKTQAKKKIGRAS